ncbi:MAG: AI-2E family transporter [Bacteroidia bacterium]
MPFYNIAQRRNIILILMILLGVFLMFSMVHIFGAILGAVVLYTLFKPAYLYFHEKWRLPPSLSAAFIILLSFIIIIVPLFFLSWMIIGKLIEFQHDPELIRNITDKINHYTGSHMEKPELVQQGLTNASKWAVGAFSSVMNSAFRIFINLMILYFTLFFMLVSHQKLEQKIVQYLPFNTDDSLRFGTELKNVTYSNVFGQGIIALAQGIIVGSGFLVFGIPDPLFWGIISIFVCFLPVVGAPIIFIPAGIIELAYGHTLAGVGILIWGIILVTLADNFLRFYISKKIADTHPLITIIGVVIGVPVFGIIGLVIGPLLISYFLLLVGMYEAYLRQSALPEKTDPSSVHEL